MSYLPLDELAQAVHFSPSPSLSHHVHPLTLIQAPMLTKLVKLTCQGHNDPHLLHTILSCLERGPTRKSSLSYLDISGSHNKIRLDAIAKHQDLRVLNLTLYETISRLTCETLVVQISVGLAQIGVEVVVEIRDTPGKEMGLESKVKRRTGGEGKGEGKD